MKIIKKSAAGTLESSDILVEVEPGRGVSVEIQSSVKAQFGEAIERTLRGVLSELGVDDVSMRVVDRGALDCTIRARAETAVRRASREED